jgi:very-short-patch-repair endonuclease
MPPALPAHCRELLELQSGVISRRQARSLGVPEDLIDGRLRVGAWRQLQWGVYATFTGEPARAALLWAAVLRAGPDAALSHQSAAELDHLTSQPSPRIHVTVPRERRVRGATGVVIHRSDRVGAARHPVLLPPRTRIEETVVDLTQTARTFDDAFHWLCQACGGRFTTPERLSSTLSERSRVRYRDSLSAALTDIADGVRSNLELRYVRRVERPHRLPVAQRQAQIAIGGSHRYPDNLYQEFGLAVELDGRAAHPAQHRWRDIHRDNATAGLGITTLRYSWADITEHACEVAAQIATVLRQRGWQGTARPCGPGCRALACLP